MRSSLRLVWTIGALALLLFVSGCAPSASSQQASGEAESAGAVKKVTAAELALLREVPEGAQITGPACKDLFTAADLASVIGTETLEAAQLSLAELTGGDSG